MFFLESPHSMGSLKGSQMLQQNCEQNQLYIFKIRRLIISHFPDTVNILKRQQSSPFCIDKIFSHYEFLVQLVFASCFKYKMATIEKPMWNRQEQ